MRGEPSYWPTQSVRYVPRPHRAALLPLPIAPSNYSGACDSSGRAISEGWRGSTPTTMEASMALPRERTIAYHQREAVAALISSGEAHFQHSPSRGGKRELGAEGAASLSISSHGACQPAPRARDGCSRRAACAARASGTARLTRGHVPRSPGRPRTRTPCGPGKPPPTSLRPFKYSRKFHYLFHYRPK